MSAEPEPMTRREFAGEKDLVGRVTLSASEAAWIQEQLDKHDAWAPEKPTNEDLDTWAWREVLGRSGSLSGTWRPTERWFQALSCVAETDYSVECMLDLRGRLDVDLRGDGRLHVHLKGDGRVIAIYAGPLDEEAAARALMLALYREIEGEA